MLSPLEKLKKFLMLESDRGYDNRAVVGGLDKILPSWKAEAASTGIPEATIQLVEEMLTRYPQLDVRERAEAVQTLTSQIGVANHSSPVGPNLAPISETHTPPPAKPVPAAEHSPAVPHDSYQPGHVRAATQNQAGLIGLTANLTVLSGIGPKTAQTLEQLGLVTLEDLLYYFPRRYDDYSQLKPINRLQFGDEVSVLANVKSAFTRPIKGGKLNHDRSCGRGWHRRITDYLVQPALAGKIHPTGYSVGTFRQNRDVSWPALYECA